MRTSREQTATLSGASPPHRGIAFRGMCAMGMNMLGGLAAEKRDAPKGRGAQRRAQSGLSSSRIAMPIRDSRASPRNASRSGPARVLRMSSAQKMMQNS